MKRHLTVGLALAGLVLASCGSDSGGSDSGGSSDVSGPQAEAAQAAIDSAKESGLEFDEGCVNDLAAQLSDADAEAIVAAGDGQSDLSPEGEALSTELINCADQDALIDLFISGIAESGQDVDEACARDALGDFDVAEIVTATQGGDPPTELIQALVPCFDLGG